MVDRERFYVFRTDHWVQKPDHLWYRVSHNSANMLLYRALIEWRVFTTCCKSLRQEIR